MRSTGTERKTRREGVGPSAPTAPASEAAPAPAILVIGYGNPLRGDDAAGRVVAEAVADALEGDERVLVVVRHGLVPELAEPLSRARLAIFIDASVELRNGAVRERPVEYLPFVTLWQMHHLTPESLLTCAHRLFKRQPRAVALEIGVRAVAHREGLSRVVKRACDVAARRACAIVRRELTAMDRENAQEPVEEALRRRVARTRQPRRGRAKPHGPGTVSRER